MQRYFLKTPFNTAGEAQITGDDAKHITKVMRMQEGDSLIAVAQQEAFLCTIDTIQDTTVLIRKTHFDVLPSHELPVSITIACGLPKGDKLDWIVQKATELGVSSMIPFKAERAIVQWDQKKSDKKVQRLQKIAKEAAEQCHRSKVPHIDELHSLSELLQRANHFNHCFIADEEEAKVNEPQKMADLIKNVQPGQSVLAVFGPEGGLTRQEVAQFQAAGFLSISLGPRILRAETAPLYFLAATSFTFE